MSRFPRTVLLLGSGELGKEVAIAAQRLGCRVIACDRYADAPAMQVSDVAEVLTMTDPVRRLVMKHATSGEIQNQAVSEGMRTMYQDGLLKCLRGVTTLDEVLRVTQEA